MAFTGCEKLESIIIPNGVKYLGISFLNCKELKSITVSEGVKSIEAATFLGCENIKEVNVLGTRPPKIRKESFNETICSTAILYVPAGCKKAYSKARGWKQFKNVTEK